ncbi:MAG: uridine kinase [Burkholderiales bacterium]|nr:uridine kinase [Burkholderiales bacterium]
MHSFIIGVAGGSGSGKSTVTDYIISVIGKKKVAVIMQDYYYKDLSHLTLDDRKKINFDHPDAFDWELLSLHVNNLYHGIPIEMPTYDFAQYTRKKETIVILPSQIVIFEGIFALMDPKLRSLMALKIYVDTASDIRFIRRVQRDINERERTVESVIRQYLDYVRPMHNQFIEPTKRYSHIIIPHGANQAALEMIIARIHAVFNGAQLINGNYFIEE